MSRRAYPPRSVLVYADGRLVFAGPPAFARPDVAVAVGKPALTHAGYAVLIPEREVRVNGARRDVRIFALVGGHALRPIPAVVRLASTELPSSP